MEPPVISGCKFEGKFVILIVIFSNINIVTVGGAVMERTALDFGFFVCFFAPDIAVFDELFLDLHKVILG